MPTVYVSYVGASGGVSFVQVGAGMIVVPTVDKRNSPIRAVLNIEVM